MKTKTVTHHLLPFAAACLAAPAFGQSSLRDSTLEQRTNEYATSSNASSTDVRLAQAPDNDEWKKESGQIRTASNDTEKVRRVAGALEEIVVTAQKREEKLQDVPTSMTVLSAEKLESQGLSQLSDIAKRVPGLKLIGSGGPAQGKAVLRGVSSGSDRSAVVGVFLDDLSFTPYSTRAPVAVGYAFDPALADIERVEVLKGPQSTLYGASGLGGLIKYVSKKPNVDAVDGSLRVEGLQVDGGGAGYSTRGSINVPIVEGRVAIRASVLHREEPGYITNLANDKEDVNSSTVNAGRFSLLVKLTDNLQNTLAGLVQEITVDEPYDIFINRATLQPLNGQMALSSAVDQGDKMEFHIFNNTTELDLGFASLTNIAGYMKFPITQVTPTGPLAVAFGAANGRLTQTNETKRFSDELRLTSAPGRLEWMLGAYYAKEEGPVNLVARGTDASGTLLPSSNPSSELYTYFQEYSFEELAGFGNLTYHISDQLALTVGARYSTNDQTNRAVGTGRIYGAAGFHSETDSSDSATNYLATLTYEPTETLTLYARAASAYRPGGPNALVPEALALGVPEMFTSDEVWSYELGVKGTAWDRKLNFSVAAYYLDWKDTQVLVPFIASNGSAFATTQNAGAATVRGAEAAIDLRVTSGLTVGINGAYNDAQVDVTLPSISSTAGDPLPYSPKTTLAGFLDYTTPVGRDMQANAGISYNYYSEQYSVFKTSPLALRLPSYHSVDVRAGLDWSNYSLVARVENLTDEQALTTASATSGYLGSPSVGRFIRPRTFSLGLEVRF